MHMALHLAFLSYQISLASFHGSPFRSVPILVAASFSSVLEFLKWFTIDGCLCCFQNWKQMVMVVADYHVRSSKEELKKVAKDIHTLISNSVL